MKKAMNFGLLLQMGVVVFICALWGEAIPLPVQSAFYAVSLTLRNILFFFLPFIIFSYLFQCVLSFQKGAFLLIGLLIFFVCFSNMASTLVAFGVGSSLIHQIPQLPSDAFGFYHTLLPLWHFKFPQLLPNELALFSGLLAGGFFSLYPQKRAQEVSLKLKKAADFFLLKIFLKLMPLFVGGFIIKMQHDGVLSLIIKSYGKIFFLIFITQVFYISFLYGLAAKFKKKTFFSFVKNALPAGLTGFTSMSSAAALPLSIKGAEENTKNPELARAVAPATVSIHLVGDSLGIPIMALAILHTFGHALPSFWEYIPFCFFFVLAKFAVAAVPGGGILVMVPVLEGYLGFSPSMSVLITTVYILFDPVVTGANVMGNGAFSILFNQIFQKMQSQFQNPFKKRLNRS